MTARASTTPLRILGIDPGLKRLRLGFQLLTPGREHPVYAAPGFEGLAQRDRFAVGALDLQVRENLGLLDLEIFGERTE